MVSPGGSWQDVRPRLVLLLAASGCNRAADQGVDPLTRKGIPQLADACVRGSGGSCRIVGDKYLKGSGVPKDVNAAIAYYTRGCFTDPDSCVALGVLRLEGREVPKNESEALALFRNACSRGSWNGCSDLGMMYQKGQGGVADPAFGADLFRKGSEREDPLSTRPSAGGKAKRPCCPPARRLKGDATRRPCTPAGSTSPDRAARMALYPAAELSVDLAMRARSTFESHDHLV